MWVWASGAGRVGAQQGVERAFQVCEGIAFARDVAIRGVALHLRIAQAPERHRLGVEPDGAAEVGGVVLLLGLMAWGYVHRESLNGTDFSQMERRARLACAEGKHDRAAALYGQAARSPLPFDSDLCAPCKHFSYC